MTKYKYKVKYSSQFKKSLKKIAKQGKDIDILLDTIDKLADNEELDATYNNHKLRDDKYYRDCWECHLGTTRSDWLLVYQYDNENLIILMVNTGSHSELFGK
jgi:mRNA interferase YafQ